MPSHPPLIKETNKWLVVNKPAGLNVEQLWDYPSVEAQVKNYLRRTPQKDPYLGIVHRLDRPVSGALLLAKKISTLRELNQQFADRQVQKVYWAICSGTLSEPAGTLENYLVKDQKNKRALAFATPRSGAVFAQLSYRVFKSQAGLSFLEVRPLTGKFHQIRIQLANAGCPILGDEKYGGRAVDVPNTIALHARKLSFTDPATKEPQEVTAELLPEQVLWKEWDSCEEI